MVYIPLVYGKLGDGGSFCLTNTLELPQVFGLFSIKMNPNLAKSGLLSSGDLPIHLGKQLANPTN